MARTALTKVTPKGPYTAISPGDLALAFTAADAVNGNKFPLSGTEIVLMQNTDTGAHHVTISSTPDDKGRSGDIASYSIAAGAFAVWSARGAHDGWKESDGNLYISADDATIKFAVLNLAT